MEDKMEAKGQDTIKTRNEMHFFELIEKRMLQQGFEVLETLDLDRDYAAHPKEMLAHRLTNPSY
jgi:hypothetical protein